MKSFFQMFYLLDQCYNKCKQDDTGVFLGAISPEIWEHGMPADMAVLNDWTKQFEEITIDESNLKSVTMKFLLYYEENYGFSFYQLKDFLPLCDENMVEYAIHRGEKRLDDVSDFKNPETSF